MMGGFGSVDFMVKSYKNNRALLKSRKSLKELYNEMNSPKKSDSKLSDKQFSLDKRIEFRKKLKRQARILLFKKMLVLFSVLSILVLSATYLFFDV